VSGLVDKAKAQLLESSSSGEFVQTLRKLFPRLLAHEVSGHIEVNNGRPPILTIKIVGNNQFQTTENKNTSGGSLVRITQPPVWNVDRLFDRLANMEQEVGQA